MSWRPGEPRFVVREIEGFAVSYRSGAVPSIPPLLSCSVLDRAFCYEEVARFNQEDERGLPRKVRHERIRAKAADLALRLEIMCR